MLALNARGHRLVDPLRFNVPGNGGPIARAEIEDTLENVGNSPAVDVLYWEDIIPLGPQAGYQDALKRRAEYCDAKRHPNPQGPQGSVLFPKDPITARSIVGPYMSVVTAAVAKSAVRGKVGFAMVGCVSYRFSFEQKTAPTHQTRFLYFLGRVDKNGFTMPYVTPEGVATQLQLVEMPDGFSAD
jgi:hypothetical protein